MRSLISIGISLAIVLVAGGFLLLFVFDEDAESIEDLETEEPAPTVTVQILEPQEIIDSRILTGRLFEWEGVTHSAERAGKIEWLGHDEGDRVKAGDELVRIDMTEANAHLAQAEADYRLAEQELKRIEGLRGGGISSPRELDQVLARRDAARAALELARIDVNRSVVHAELDGIIDRQFSEAGEYVQVGQPLVRVIQTDRVLFVTGAPERDVPYFDEGDPVVCYVDAYPGERFLGNIHHISTSAHPDTLTFVTEIEIANDHGKLRPGMLAKGVFVKQRFPDAIAVPLFAVLRDGRDRYVFVERDGVAEKHTIEVGFYEGENILTTDGLSAGDRLVVVGQRQLADGMPVDVHEAVPQPPVQASNPFAPR